MINNAKKTCADQSATVVPLVIGPTHKATHLRWHRSRTARHAKGTKASTKDRASKSTKS